MASFLTICQSVHRKMRGGNAAPGTQPTNIPVPATPAPDQMTLDIVDAVQQAWENLQNLHPSWLWMRRQSTLPLVATTRTYPLSLIRVTTPLYDWLVPFDAGSPSGGPTYCNLYDGGASLAARTDYSIPFVAYENWRGYADRNPIQQTAMPARFTQWPDYTLEFDPTPNVTPTGGAWILRFDYRKTNQALSVAADVPECPVKYHELIAWMAVQLVCETRNSTGYLMQLAAREIRDRMAQLEANQIPQMLIDLRYV